MAAACDTVIKRQVRNEEKFHKFGEVTFFMRWRNKYSETNGVYKQFDSNRPPPSKKCENYCASE